MNGFPFLLPSAGLGEDDRRKLRATTSLAQLDSQMPLWLRHLAPELL